MLHKMNIKISIFYKPSIIPNKAFPINDPENPFCRSADRHNSVGSVGRLVVLGFNPLPDIPIIGSFNSTANKDMMPKILTNWDTIF